MRSGQACFVMWATALPTVLLLSDRRPCTSWSRSSRTLLGNTCYSTCPCRSFLLVLESLLTNSRSTYSWLKMSTPCPRRIRVSSSLLTLDVTMRNLGHSQYKGISHFFFVLTTSVLTRLGGVFSSKNAMRFSATISAILARVS